MSSNFERQNNSQQSVGTQRNAVRWFCDQIDLVIGAHNNPLLLEAADRYWTRPEWETIRQYLSQLKTASVLHIGVGRDIASYATARDDFLVEGHP